MPVFRDSRGQSCSELVRKGRAGEGQKQTAPWGPIRDFLDGGAKQLEMSLDQALVHLALRTRSGAGQEWRPPLREEQTSGRCFHQWNGP